MEEDGPCDLCLDFTERVIMSTCGHRVCKDCINSTLKKCPRCPVVYEDETEDVPQERIAWRQSAPQLKSGRVPENVVLRREMDRGVDRPRPHSIAAPILESKQPKVNSKPLLQRSSSDEFREHYDENSPSDPRPQTGTHVGKESTSHEEPSADQKETQINKDQRHKGLQLLPAVNASLGREADDKSERISVADLKRKWETKKPRVGPMSTNDVINQKIENRPSDSRFRNGPQIRKESTSSKQVSNQSETPTPTRTNKYQQHKGLQIPAMNSTRVASLGEEDDKAERISVADLKKKWEHNQRRADSTPSKEPVHVQDLRRSAPYKGGIGYQLLQNITPQEPGTIPSKNASKEERDGGDKPRSNATATAIKKIEASQLKVDSKPLLPGNAPAVVQSLEISPSSKQEVIPSKEETVDESGSIAAADATQRIDARQSKVDSASVQSKPLADQQSGNPSFKHGFKHRNERTSRENTDEIKRGKLVDRKHQEVNLTRQTGTKNDTTDKAENLSLVKPPQEKKITKKVIYDQEKSPFNTQQERYDRTNKTIDKSATEKPQKVLGGGSIDESSMDRRSKLVAERFVHEEARDLLEAERETHDDIRQAHEDTHGQLVAERFAHEEARGLLEAERETHDDTRQAHEDTQSQLMAERFAHEETRGLLEAERESHDDTREANEDTQSQLVAERCDHEETQGLLVTEREAHDDTRSRLEFILAAEQHEETRSRLERDLAAEHQAHDNTRRTLVEELQAHDAIRRTLAEERRVHEETRIKLAAALRNRSSLSK